ncbi:MAG: 50S ribosomal protein L5, partial [Abditibacteriaceae bacterium]
MTPYLKQRYQEHVIGALSSQFKFENVMQVPKLTKVVINMGVSEARDDAKLLDAAMADLATISGQKPAMRRARKSIANFKLREG